MWLRRPWSRLFPFPHSEQVYRYWRWWTIRTWTLRLRLYLKVLQHLEHLKTSPSEPRRSPAQPIVAADSRLCSKNKEVDQWIARDAHDPISPVPSTINIVYNLTVHLIINSHVFEYFIYHLWRRISFAGLTTEQMQNIFGHLCKTDRTSKSIILTSLH